MAAQSYFMGTRRRLMLAVAVAALAVIAATGAFGLPLVMARSAERAAMADATRIGDKLVELHATTGTYPDELTADNSDGNHPQVLADGKPLPAISLADGMVIYYYGAVPARLAPPVAGGDQPRRGKAVDFTFCVEHHTGSGAINAYARYGTEAQRNGARIGALGNHENGESCLGAD
ncbi:MAG: hypothetical protein WKF50_06035 [Nocardioides sp.]